MMMTILVLTYVAMSMIILFPFGFLAALLRLIGFRKSMTWVFSWYQVIWSNALLKVTGCKVIVKGQENIPEKGGVCFVSNHCGYFDIVMLLAYCKRSFGFVAKRELLFVPILDIWIYILGGLFIDRKNLRRANKTINKGIQKMKNGGCMVIFPEGHRSKGRGLLPFHPGSLKLATMAETTIVPVAIEGSYEIFEKTQRFIRSQAAITFCEPINVSEIPASQRKFELCDKIYSVIKEQLKKGDSEAAGSE